MDDFTSRISELLSDEESVKQLTELANMLVSEERSEKSEDHTASEAVDDQPDLGTVLKITGLMGAASNENKNTDLLLALKPHLGKEKQKRVDKAIKLMKLLAMWNVLKDSGLLQELI